MGIKTPHNFRPEELKNYIINGDMRIAQRGTSFPAIADGTYSLDRWNYGKAGAMVHTISQDTDVPTVAQAGVLFQNSLRLNLTTPDTAIAAGEAVGIQQLIEGFNWADLAQKTFTLSFWVKATLPGIYCVSLRNTGLDRSYIAEYTINTTNTWEYKSITVSPSPSAGTWNYTNGLGVRVQWTLAAGSSFQTSANAWQTGSFTATANQVNGVNTGATDFRITGVMLNLGANAAPFRLFGNDIEGELAACQRYYEKSYDLATAPGTNMGGGVTSGMVGWGVSNITYMFIPYKVRKRVNLPTFRYWDGAGNLSRARRNATDNVLLTSGTPIVFGENGLIFRDLTGATTELFIHYDVSAEL